MTLNIETGKFYRDAEGNKVGPMTRGISFSWVEGEDNGSDPDWHHDGTIRDRGVARLTRDLIAEWPYHPTLWRDMTEAEQGALLLAHHQGKVIEYRIPTYESDWTVNTSPLWALDFAYRVRPEPEVKVFAVHSRPKEPFVRFSAPGIILGTYAHPDGHTIIVEEQ